MLNIKIFLSNLSHHPGVYQMLGESGEVLYVGKAKNLKKRISSYFTKNSTDLKTASLIKQIKDIDITVTYSENEAVLLECNLIKKHRPRYNVLLRDDKSYPYILISIDHPFPRIDLYRGARRKGGLYFGPYPSAGSVRETISLLQKIFGIRTCRDNHFDARSRPCLLYQIGRCTGACAGLITKEEYDKNLQLAILFLEGKSDIVIEQLQVQMEGAAKGLDFETAAHIRDRIKRLRSIQERQYINVTDGNADVIGMAVQAGIICVQLLSIRGGQILGSRSYFPTVPSHATHAEIITAFITQHYLSHPSHIDAIPKEIIVEEAILDKKMLENVLSDFAKQKVVVLNPARGEKHKWIQMAAKTAEQTLSAHVVSKTNMEDRLRALQAALHLAKLPERIECFDISHSSGEATVASCVVFNQEGPLKRDYRRFNIKNIIPGDDVAAMRQVLERRFKRLQKDAVAMPEVVLIDGGVAQRRVAQEILQSLNITGLKVIGVSKGPDRKPGFETLITDEGPRHLPADSIALHLIQQIRDEAHRFAITGHRNKRDKTRRQSTLELIPGIGAKRRRELLRYFGGIQGLAHASLDELTKVPGINRSLAERIFATLHDTIP
ncbi:MAG: excinuclease ABC subunit UvrC [Gammaproteobacteria bacterium]|nr:excinuclease ABC subunit UvrC [Gammaproteobacteria bacterium]